MGFTTKIYLRLKSPLLLTLLL